MGSSKVTAGPPERDAGSSVHFSWGNSTDYILPFLGHYPVAALNEYMVRTWYEDLAKAGCSPDLRNKCGQLLRRCLDKCVSDGDIKTNPTRKLSLPRVVAEEMHPLDTEQARDFLAVSQQETDNVLY